jgi:hypothetical protein
MYVLTVLFVCLFVGILFPCLDGERCGDTLKSIFENAKDPSRVFVGVVEQNQPTDKGCIEQYCNSFGT